MKQTARLRLAVSLAAAITAVHPGAWVAAAQDKGPDPVPGTPATEQQTPAPAPAPARGARRETYPFRGTIALLDATARTLTLEGRQTRRVIHVVDATRLERDGRRIPFEELKAGEAVTGTLRKTSAGAEEAVLLRIGVKAGGGDAAGAGAGAGATSGPSEVPAERPPSD